MNYKIFDDYIQVFNGDEFNIKHILECGQVFRYKNTPFGYTIYSAGQKIEHHISTLENYVEEMQEMLINEGHWYLHFTPTNTLKQSLNIMIAQDHISVLDER